MFGFAECTDILLDVASNGMASAEAIQSALRVLLTDLFKKHLLVLESILGRSADMKCRRSSEHNVLVHGSR